MCGNFSWSRYHQIGEQGPEWGQVSVYVWVAYGGSGM